MNMRQHRGGGRGWHHPGISWEGWRERADQLGAPLPSVLSSFLFPLNNSADRHELYGNELRERARAYAGMGWCMRMAAPHPPSSSANGNDANLNGCCASQRRMGGGEGSNDGRSSQAKHILKALSTSSLGSDILR